MCVSLEQSVGAVERVEATLTVKELLCGVLAGLRGEERLASFDMCVIE